ncbi:hypothetical protein SBRCBS47491_009728 [Sporothrix bragantina]|uniref:Chitin-binding type-1 domain-containing protein n=1 Tax=Sporothrix bragantina TaxID=671064 RepID=A0ABP0CY22_9PEZI
MDSTICELVFHFGARFNHPMGVFSPGARTMTRLFRSTLAALDKDRTVYGLLGGDLFRGGASTRASNDTILLVLYFRNVEGLQLFGNSMAHCEAFQWLRQVTTAGVDGKQKYPHLSAFHETFVVPAGGYETLYINTAPILLGNTFNESMEREGVDEGEELKKDQKPVWISSLVDADDVRLRTMAAHSDETISSIWVTPDATLESFTLTLKAGESIDLAWTGGMSGDTMADLWVAAYAYGVDDTFSQLLTKQIDLAVDGAFNWTVDIPQPQLDATPHYVLTFKTARDDFQFNASEPGLPSPGFSVIENDGDGLAVDNGTDGFANGTDTSAASATTSSDASSSSDIFGGDRDGFNDGDGDDDDGDDDGSDDGSDDGDYDGYDDGSDSSSSSASSSSNGSSTGSSTTSASIPDGFTTTVNATCGGTLTCIGSVFGDCCSQHNFCGSTDDYCGAGCLSAFGNCDSTLSTTSTATPTPTPEPMSVAATAGIATGVSVSVIALFIGGWFWFRRRSSVRRRSQQNFQQQQQNMLGGVSGNYLGDGSSAVFYNGGDGVAAKQRPYLMLETGRNGPMPVYGHNAAKSIDTSHGSPDSMYPINQRPQTSSSTMAGTPHLANVSMVSLHPPPPVPPLQQSQQRSQQESVFEMEGGGSPYHYGHSQPAELEGGSPVH